MTELNKLLEESRFPLGLLQRITGHWLRDELGFEREVVKQQQQKNNSFFFFFAIHIEVQSKQKKKF